jgi:hypothetical protein
MRKAAFVAAFFFFYPISSEYQVGAGLLTDFGPVVVTYTHVIRKGLGEKRYFGYDGVGLTRFPHCPQGTVHRAQSTVHSPQSTGCSPQSTVHSPQLGRLVGGFGSPLKPNYRLEWGTQDGHRAQAQSTVHGPQGTVHSPQGAGGWVRDTGDVSC